MTYGCYTIHIHTHTHTHTHTHNTHYTHTNTPQAVERRPILFPRTELVRDVLPGIYNELRVREELIESKVSV
jgi:hypothetical protein